jgi:hypothetical protein
MRRVGGVLAMMGGVSGVIQLEAQATARYSCYLDVVFHFHWR